MGKYFGTDGFRGEAGIDLTADHAYKVGRFLGWYYNALRERNGNNEPARIVIGKDTRRSSYMFEYSLVAGLTASGADAYLLHVTTTPSVAYIARVDDFDCGIMISASHNPFYDNGIKLIDCYGEKMPEETLLLVEDYLDGKLHVFDKDWPELPFAHREHIGCTVDYVAGRNRYMGYLISLGIYSFKRVKVGLDCANGASWNIAKSVFDALGADTYVINNKPNGTNINNNAGSTHIEGLQKFVVEKGLDVGFAYDGDADRCLCVDEKGNVITGDHILYTGPIDAYFDYKLGTLEYRSVRFENELLDKPNFQGNAAVNYTDRETPWTRIIEHKWFEFGKDENGNDLPKTIISREYSSEWKPGDEPYYPVNDATNSALYAEYKKLADAEPKVIFGGRLGEYKYYDMDKVIEQALEKVNVVIK